MNVAIFSATTLICVFMLHVVMWRVRLPSAQTRTLLLLFLGALPVAIGINALLPASFPARLDGLWQHVQASLFHVTMSLAYVVFYTSIEGDGPSFTLLLFVEKAGAAGRLEGELYDLIDEKFILGHRLVSLVDGGFLSSRDGLYQITAKGRAWTRLFQFVRRVYRLEMGG